MKLKFLITALTLLIINNSVIAMTARDLDNYERREREEQNQKNNDSYNTVKVTNNKVSDNSACDSTTNLVREMFQQVKQQQQAISELCNVGGMNKCSGASQQKLLEEYQRNIKSLSASIVQISEDALKKACSQ